ncbi:trypco2 family protein [Streptomyces sp. HD]|uniref:trypco2 family protein n=1 Tax=Streptomyces sp. HD TaxID=3020892 RepID=UPI003FA73C8D
MIELAEIIRELRNELNAALADGSATPVRFEPGVRGTRGPGGGYRAEIRPHGVSCSSSRRTDPSAPSPASPP